MSYKAYPKNLEYNTFFVDALEAIYDAASCVIVASKLEETDIFRKMVSPFLEVVVNGGSGFAIVVGPGHVAARADATP